MFQNCRATREIELCERFPQHVVAKWLGHSESIARRHYLNVTEDHFRRAADEPTGRPEKAVQNPVQSVTAQGRGEPQEEPADEAGPAICGALRGSAASCEHMEMSLVPPRGLEPLSSG